VAALLSAMLSTSLASRTYLCIYFSLPPSLPPPSLPALGGGLHRLGFFPGGQVAGRLRPTGRRGRPALGDSGGGGCVLGRAGRPRYVQRAWLFPLALPSLCSFPLPCPSLCVFSIRCFKRCPQESNALTYPSLPPSSPPSPQTSRKPKAPPNVLAPTRPRKRWRSIAPTAAPESAAAATTSQRGVQ
jgi:hypothetical protein